MLTADVQAVASKLVTVTKNVAYLAKTSSVGAIDFDNLTSAADVTFIQAGNYNLGKLTSAANIYLGENYSTKNNVIDLGALKTVTSLNTTTGSEHNSGASVSAATRVQTGSTAANTIDFSRATNIHLTSLAVYAPGELTLNGAKDFTLKIDALTSQDAEGEEVGMDLDIDGAAELNSALLVTGDVNTSNVPSITLSKLQTADAGTVGDAETLVLGAVVGNLTLAGTDLETATITTILDPEDEDDEIGGSVTVTSTSVADVTISGVSAAIDFTGATDLETASVSGTASSVKFSGNTSLTGVTLTAAVTGAVTVNNSDDLVTLDLAHTVAAGEDETNGSLVVTGNAKLSSLTADKINKVGTLTITSNDDLSTISFAALKVAGTDDAGSVSISGNNLTAQKIEDYKEATGAAAGTNTGKITSDSGINGLKAYLDAAIAADMDVSVSFDTVDLYVDATGDDDVETSNITSGTKLVVVDYSAGTTTTATKTEIRETVSFVVDINRNDNTVTYAADLLGTGEAVTIGALGLTAVYTKSDELETVADLIAAINAETKFGDGVTITASEAGSAKSIQTISYTDAAGAVETTASAGNVVVSFAGVTGTLTLASGNGSAAIATAAAALLNAEAKLALYNFTASGSTIVVTENVTTTTTRNLGTAASFSASEKLGFSINVSTTVSFGGASSTVGLNSDYFLSVSQKNVNGLLVTFKNNSTSVAFATSGAASVTIANADALGATATELVSSTTRALSNMDANTGLDAEFSNVQNASSTSTTTGDSEVDYTAWL